MASGGLCRVNNLETAAERRGLSPKHKVEVLKCAFQYLNEFRNGSLVYEYNLKTNNCEHFATRCKFGTGFSETVGITENKPRLTSFVNVAEKAIGASL